LATSGDFNLAIDISTNLQVIRAVAAFQPGSRGRPEGCSVQLICEGMEPLGWEASLHPSLHRCRDGLRARDGAGGVYRGG